MKTHPIPCIFSLALAAVSLPASSPPLAAPYEHPAQDHVYYFVLTDRFDDGDGSNNALGGGYDPADAHAYHGGDFAGLRNRLDYLEALGVNALWLTPIFQNQSVQGGTSSYHGYWITDFLNVDRHLGTNAEFRELVEDAQARGMRIFLDIIANHTADVNRYYSSNTAYVPKGAVPYKDASGTAFDDRDYAWNGTGEPWFPELDPATSFPLRAYIPAAKANLRNPAWLNDITNYHNRGDSTFSGENSLYGDFFGLDDLFTEKPEVVQGMIDIFSYWISEYGIDGFRIDTVKHVNQEFWQAFAPAVQAAAEAAGIGHFFQFGEVFSFDPPFLSEFSTVLPLDATLDFSFAGEVRAFAYQGVSSANFTYFFSRDDLLTDADSHANARPLFVGNHDIGRAAAYARADNPGASEAEIIDRLELAEAIKFFTRGQPVIYYGDEQGFAGTGGSDVYFREDMMPSATAIYNSIDLVGTNRTTADANFDRDHPLFRSIASMADIYHAHPALRRGAHIPRSSGSARVLAVSRIHRSDFVEYLFVASNRDSGNDTVSIPTSQPGGGGFVRVGESRAGAVPAALTADASGRVSLTIEGLQWAVFRAETPLPGRSPSPSIALTNIRNGSVQTVQGYSQEGQDFPGRLEITATTDIDDYAEVTFSCQRSDQPGQWQLLGVDTAPPYRVYFRPPPDLPAGVTFDFGAAVTDARGNFARTTIRDVLLASGAPVTSLVVHYQRQDAAYNGWGIVAEGSGLPGGRVGTSASPEPFIGEDDFGSFAVIPVNDPNEPVRFVIQRPNGTSAPADRTWNGFHTVLPQSTAEIWVRHGDISLYPSEGEAQGFVSVDYRRTTTGASGWKLQVHDPVSSSVVATLDPVATAISTATYRLDPAALGLDWAGEVGLRPVSAGGSTEGAVRTVPLRASGIIRLREGSDAVFLTAAAFTNVATIHYRRPAGDYGNYASSNHNDYWGMHVWSGAASPTAWSAPVKPVREDAFGVVFEVPLAPGAGSLSYIIHRGDTKDPGPDQSLPLQSAGYEVWQLQGADIEAPYVRTTGPRAIYGGFPSPEAAAMGAGLRVRPDLSLEYYAPMGRRFQLQQKASFSAPWTDFGDPLLGTGEFLEADLPDPLGQVRLFRLLVD